MHEGPLLLPSGHVSYVAPQEFDLAAVPDAVMELTRLIELHPWVAVDLSPVAFIDSSALGALLVARKRAVELGGDVVLVGATPRTLRMLELTQLDHVFPVFATHDEVPVRPPRSPAAPAL
jgi:anti-sigma B factor antagonist